MNKRFFQICPPSFPHHYAKTLTGDGWTFRSQYTSPSGAISLLTGINEWFDYIGDIVMEVNADLEVLEQQFRKEARRIVRDPIRPTEITRKRQLVVKKRNNRIA
jgi:hypothetical protein